jgi:hypothetical protein
MAIPRDYDQPSGNLQCQPAHNNNRLSGNLSHTSHPHLQGHANINNASSSIIRNPTTRVVDNVASCQPAPPHSYSPHHKGMRDQSNSLHPYLGRDSDSNELMTPMSATNRGSTPKVPAKRTFFVRDVPTEKASREGPNINRRWHSHTVVMADHARLTNYIPFNVGIGTCLDVTA